MGAFAAEVRARGASLAIHGVYEISKIVAGAAEPTRLFPELLSVLCSFFELSDAAVLLRRGNAGEARLIRSGGAHGDGAVLARFAARALQSGVPCVVASALEEPELVSRLGTLAELDRSLVAVPIRDRGCALGVLAIERVHSPGDQAAFCFDTDVRLLSLVANVIAAAERGAAPTRAALPLPAALPAPSLPVPGALPLSALIGEHPRWQACVARVRTAARSNSTVLLRGESGTGKEGLARYVHQCSPRAEGAYVAFNCAALSETLLESELFGHEKGAFTGAAARRRGRFELADGGTLFLDEIGEISPAFQARLLRVLQLGEFERVGGTSTLKVDVRVVAATSRDLEAEVEAGRFRADLYYRISVIPVIVPALRDRAEDIALLATEFLRRFNATQGSALRLSPSALRRLMAHDFPGNVRELENAVCRAATLAQGALLCDVDFDWLIDRAARPSAAPRASVSPSELESEARLTRERLVSAMEQSGWVQAKAARLLGLTPRQVGYALHRLGVHVKRF
jgi:Nif-specific regulatory protein